MTSNGEHESVRRGHKEDAMRNSSVHQSKAEEVRRSSSVVINPYFIDDVALTRRELDQLRRSDVMVIVPR